jgi:hypothetical protein
MWNLTILTCSNATSMNESVCFWLSRDCKTSLWKGRRPEWNGVTLSWTDFDYKQLTCAPVHSATATDVLRYLVQILYLLHNRMLWHELSWMYCEAAIGYRPWSPLTILLVNVCLGLGECKEVFVNHSHNHSSPPPQISSSVNPTFLEIFNLTRKFNQFFILSSMCTEH